MTVTDLLASHPFLAGMSQRDLDRLAYWARKAVFRAGRRIFSEGGRADRFWLIREGLVTLDFRTPSGGVVYFESLGAGGVLGWSWLSPPYRWHFGAVAQQPTLAIEVDAAGIRELCDADPAFGYELYQRFVTVVVDRLQTTRTRTLGDRDQGLPDAPDGFVSSAE